MAGVVYHRCRQRAWLNLLRLGLFQHRRGPAAKMISTVTRCFLCRTKLQEARRRKEALRIQSSWRGHRGRRRAATLRRCRAVAQRPAAAAPGGEGTHPAMVAPAACPALLCRGTDPGGSPEVGRPKALHVALPARRATHTTARPADGCRTLALLEDALPGFRHRGAAAALLPGLSWTPIGQGTPLAARDLW